MAASPHSVHPQMTGPERSVCRWLSILMTMPFVQARIHGLPLYFNSYRKCHQDPVSSAASAFCVSNLLMVQDRLSPGALWKSGGASHLGILCIASTLFHAVGIFLPSSGVFFFALPRVRMRHAFEWATSFPGMKQLRNTMVLPGSSFHWRLFIVPVVPCHSLASFPLL